MIGVDEVGRGPLAGPVTVCAVAMRVGFKGSTFGPDSQGRTLGFGSRVRDSKALSAKQREAKLREFKELRAQGLLDWRVASVSARVIDEKGIVPAVHLAIAQALRNLLSGETAKLFGGRACLPARQVTKCQVLLDGGLRAPREYTNQRTITRGDATVAIIAAASIIAKVHRDKYMARLAREFPWYGFEKHKGYGTREHYALLKKHGISPPHRRTFLGLQ